MAIGAPERVGVVPETDATAVRGCAAAGAILLGKTNCPPYGGGIETDNPVYGRTNNPYDPARTPGGSSGGEAAIVAAAGSRLRRRDRLRRQHPHPGPLLRPRGAQAHGGPDPGDRRDRRRGPDRRARRPAHAGRPAGALRRRRRAAAAGPRRAGRPRRRRPAGAAREPGGGRRARPARRRFAAYDHDEADAATAAVLADAAAALREAGAIVEEAAPPAGGHDITLEVWRSYGGEIDSLELYRLLRRWDAFRAEMLAFGEATTCSSPPSPPARRRRTARCGHTGVDPTSFTTPHSLTGCPRRRSAAAARPRGCRSACRSSPHPWRDDVALAAAPRSSAPSAAGAPRRSDPRPCAILGRVKRFAAPLVAVAAVGSIVAFAAGDSTAATAVAIALIGMRRRRRRLAGVPRDRAGRGPRARRGRGGARAGAGARARAAGGPAPAHARPRPRPPPPAAPEAAGMSRDLAALIADLTLDEKAALTAGRDNWATAAVERAGIPSVRVTDGPNGARGSALLGAGEATAVCIPCGSALGATWDPELIERVGAMLGEESRTKGCRVLLAPTRQPPPLAARGPQLRVLLRGSAARRPRRRGVRARRAVAGRRHDASSTSPATRPSSSATR